MPETLVLSPPGSETIRWRRTHSTRPEAEACCWLQQQMGEWDLEAAPLPGLHGASEGRPELAPHVDPEGRAEAQGGWPAQARGVSPG